MNGTIGGSQHCIEPVPLRYVHLVVANHPNGQCGSRIPDPGVKKAPDPGSGSATLQMGCKNNIETKFCSV